MRRRSFLVLAVALSIPRSAHACACGCGVFEVGTSSMFPMRPGGMAFLEYDYMDQNQNWSGSSKAPAANNDDKQILTNFQTAGFQYMLNRSWGVMTEAPFWERDFKTAVTDTQIGEFNHSALGDIRLRGIYSGFEPNMSAGLTFGLKLPTGDWRYPGFDRDTEIGTGSTDLLLGGYRMGWFAPSSQWNWFLNGQWDQPMLIQEGYRPGAELDAVAGAYYDGWRLSGVKIAPLAQLTGSYRWSDSGPAADPADSGYRRLILSAGLELDFAGMRVYSDVGVPVYQYFNGNQLVASALYKMNVSYAF